MVYNGIIHNNNKAITNRWNIIEKHNGNKNNYRTMIYKRKINNNNKNKQIQLSITEDKELVLPPKQW